MRKLIRVAGALAIALVPTVLIEAFTPENTAIVGGLAMDRSTGQPINGVVPLAVSLFTDASSTTPIWSEREDAFFNNGCLSTY
jgi:hypothetical protein